MAILIGFLPVVGLGVDLPTLVFEAPPPLMPLVERLQQMPPDTLRTALDVVGLGEPGPPISITLAEEDSDAARRTPPWVSGYTVIPTGAIVLFPARQLSYPHRSLQELLMHELTHVFVLRATRGHDVPRWFQEGLAMVASGERDLTDLAYGFWIGLTISPIPLHQLDRLFGEEAARIRTAYVIAEALVRYLRTQYGPSAPTRILAQRAEGLPFEEALQRATGQRLADIERDFWPRQTGSRRWIPILTSSTILWTAIVALAIWAFRRQRKRAAAVRQQWEEEEDDGHHT